MREELGFEQDVNLSSPRPVEAIILAAGQGRRMGGDSPKVVYPVAGRPMIWWVVKACKQVGVSRCLIVVGYRGDEVRAALEGQQDCVFVEQNEQLGTGHATSMAQPCFEGRPTTDVFVLAGDGPLIRPQTLARLLEAHRTTDACATLATAILDNPAGYGRVLRGEQGSFLKIVEQKDATAQQLQVREINPSYYCFRSDHLFDALSHVSNTNAQGEYYLTDVPELIQRSGHNVTVVDAVPPRDVKGVNDMKQLAEVDEILRARLEKSRMQRVASGKPA